MRCCGSFFDVVDGCCCVLVVVVCCWLLLCVGGCCCVLVVVAIAVADRDTWKWLLKGFNLVWFVIHYNFVGDSTHHLFNV